MTHHVFADSKDIPGRPSSTCAKQRHEALSYAVHSDARGIPEAQVTPDETEFG